MVINRWRPIAWRSRSVAGCAAAAVLLVAAAGCSSSKAGTSPGTGSTGSGASSSGGASSGTSGGLALARSRASQYEKPSTSSISSLPPLKAKPPSGKTVVFVFQDIPQGEAKATGIKNAAAAVGWHYKQILVNNSDPATVVAGINQAIEQYHANVVSVTGLTIPEMQSTFATATKAGAIIVPQDGIFAPTGPIPAVVGGTAYYTRTGAMLADWVTAQSHGKANIVFGAIDAFSALAQVRKGFDSELASVCPGCKVTPVQLTIDQAVNNQGNSVITSALQRDSGANYVVTVDGALFGGLHTALSAVGLGGRVVIASAVGSVVNQTAILKGQEAVTTGDPNEIMGWLTIDAALRHMEGMSYPSDYGIPPTQLLTKANSSTWTVNNDFQVPANFAEVFKKLWGVSS